jgi:hypothetical protein
VKHQSRADASRRYREPAVGVVEMGPVCFKEPRLAQQTHSDGIQASGKVSLRRKDETSSDLDRYLNSDVREVRDVPCISSAAAVLDTGTYAYESAPVVTRKKRKAAKKSS